MERLSFNNINKIMLQNPYEKMIPFNLWFYHPDYEIIDHYENNQHLRLRYFKGILLTPVVAKAQHNLEAIKNILDYMPLYQPFYPETFYC